MRRPLHTDEGGSGYTSGDPSKTRWANWATAYVKYCDGGSMTGTREDSTPQRNGSSGPLWCKCCRRLELLPAFLTSSSNPCTDRGKYNLDAQLEHMVAAHSLKTFDRIILSGCSAGGMACYIHCDYVHDFFAPIDVKCICDAGIFLDVETVTGAGNVMQQRYHDIADVMESKPGLSKACVAAVRAPPRYRCSPQLAAVTTPLAKPLGSCARAGGRLAPVHLLSIRHPAHADAHLPHQLPLQLWGLGDAGAVGGGHRHGAAGLGQVLAKKRRAQPGVVQAGALRRPPSRSLALPVTRSLSLRLSSTLSVAQLALFCLCASSSLPVTPSLPSTLRLHKAERAHPHACRQCNATQVKIINGYREGFVTAVSNAVKKGTPHGAFLDSCPVRSAPFCRAVTCPSRRLFSKACALVHL